GQGTLYRTGPRRNLRQFGRSWMGGYGYVCTGTERFENEQPHIFDNPSWASRKAGGNRRANSFPVLGIRWFYHWRGLQRKRRSGAGRLSRFLHRTRPHVSMRTKTAEQSKFPHLTY